MAKSLSTGEWVTRHYADRADAVKVWRRIRSYVRRHKPNVRVQSRTEPIATGVNLWIKITERKDAR